MSTRFRFAVTVRHPTYWAETEPHAGERKALQRRRRNPAVFGERRVHDAKLEGTGDVHKAVARGAVDDPLREDTGRGRALQIGGGLTAHIYQPRVSIAQVNGAGRGISRGGMVRTLVGHASPLLRETRVPWLSPMSVHVHYGDHVPI